MAKGNMLLGHARGKVGDLVFSRTNGQQVVRAKASQVKNPQTQAQMIQRIIMATVLQAYSKMSAITDHSFEGVKPGQDSMSVFMRKNIKRLRQRVADAVANGQSLLDIYAFTPVGAGTYAPNSFIVSTGSLPTITPQIQSSKVKNLMSVNGETYADVISYYGLQRGDQLTFIEMEYSTDTAGDPSFNFARVILDPRNADGTEAPLSTNLCNVETGTINLPSERNEGEIKCEMISNAQGIIGMEYSLGATNRTILGTAIIVSRKGEDGNWKRSNAALVVDNDALMTTDYYYSLGECLDFLTEGDISGLNSRYLNNAGTGNIPSEGNAGIQLTALTADSHDVLSSSSSYDMGETYGSVTMEGTLNAVPVRITSIVASRNVSANVGDTVVPTDRFLIDTASFDMQTISVEEDETVRLYLCEGNSANLTVVQVLGMIVGGVRP